jgi:hypothetical protein
VLLWQLSMQRLEVEASESRRYVHDVASLVSDSLMHALVAFTSDWGRAGPLLCVLLLLVVATATAHDVAVLGKEALRRRLERPRLVRERRRAHKGGESSWCH